VKSWGFAIGLLALALPASAQDGPGTVGELVERLDKQEAEIEALKKQVGDLSKREAPADGAAPTEPEPTADGDRIKLGLLYLESADKRFRFDLKGRVIAEYNFSDHGQEDFDNSFAARQVRLNLKGKLWERVSFQIALEFGRGASDPLRQGWVNLKVFDWLQLKGGQDKLPLSFTFLEPFKYMNHAEWPIAVGSEVQNFEVGAQLWGWLFEKKIKYVLAAFNGNGPNRRRDRDDDSDFVARVEVLPIKGLNIHVAGAFTPTQDGVTGPRNARTFGGQHTQFVTFAPTNVRRGYQQRATAGVAFRTGPLELASEFLYSRHRDLRTAAGERTNLSVWSYYVEATYILTGEEKKRTIAKVDDPLWDEKADWGNGAWGTGAFGVSLRFEDFQVEKEAFRRGYAVGTDKARSLSGTVSWWPWQGMRYSISYNFTYFDDSVLDSTGQGHHDDHVVVLRAWLTF
jgi:phosphate-selective porin